MRSISTARYTTSQKTLPHLEAEQGREKNEDTAWGEGEVVEEKEGAAAFPASLIRVPRPPASTPSAAPPLLLRARSLLDFLAH